MPKSGNRRHINWQNLRNPKGALAIFIATAAGAGLGPIAPGTWGSLVALPLIWYTDSQPLLLKIILWILVFGIGTWSAKVVGETSGVSDNQNIVIDEVVGMGITAIAFHGSWQTLVVAFVVFRIFDMIKLPPIRQIDTWSKNVTSHWVGGFGVMIDDVLAGFQGFLVIALLQRLSLLS